MVNISLLDMGNTKKRSTREVIISILSREFPLSIKKIYNQVKKEYNLEVTYQAVFKVVKEMLNDGVVEGKGKEYQLNIKWIRELENELDVIKKSYIGDSFPVKGDELQLRVNEFVAKLGPKIKEYVGKDEVCIVGIGGSGRPFGVALWKYLIREGKNVKYVDLVGISDDFKDKLFDKNKDLEKNKVFLMDSEIYTIKKKEIENRKIVFVDSEIYSGGTYRVFIGKMNKFKERFKIKDIKFAVNHDPLGVADFSVSK